MLVLRRLAVVAAYVVGATTSTGASAGAKDENAAEWLAPKWLNEWHDGLAGKGLNFGATYIADNIGNMSGGVARGAIHLGRFDFSVDADLEKLFGWTGGRFCPPGRLTDTPVLDESTSPPLAMPVLATTRAPSTPRASVRSSFLPILLNPVLRDRRAECLLATPPNQPAQDRENANCSRGGLQRACRHGNRLSAPEVPRPGYGEASGS